jgi:hypothetical protein
MEGYFGEQKNLVQGNRYRPLSLITFSIEHGLMGSLNPALSHIINIILYALTAMLLFIIICKILPYEKYKNISLIPFLITLVFIAHPIHVEAVANIKGRDEIMALLLSLSSLYFSIKYAFKVKKVWLYSACFMMFLALLAKENSITFLAIIPLTLYFFVPYRKSLIIKIFIFLFFTTAAYLLLRFNVAGVPKFNEKINDLMNNPFLEMKRGEKMATIFYTLLMYIKLLFVPYPLTHDYYPYAIPIMNFGKWQVWLSLLTYGTLIYFSLKSLKSKSIVGYSILYYLITLTIVSNIVINLGTFMNDRFIYMSSLGFCVFIVYALKYLVDKFFKGMHTLWIAIIVFLIGAYSVIGFLRVPDWEDGMTLNRSAMKVSENSARANSFMATALYEKYQASRDPEEKKALIKEARPYALKAIEIFPNYYNGNLMMSGVAAESYNIYKNLDEFLSDFIKIIDRRPDVGYIGQFLEYLNGTNVDLNKMETFYVNVGALLLKKQHSDSIKWAIHYMQLGYNILPNSKPLNAQLGVAFEMLGDPAQSNIYKNKAATLQ